MPQAERADRRRSCTAQILHSMPTSGCSQPTDLTSRSSPPAPAPAAHPPARLAHPNHKPRGASPWPGRHRKALNDEGAVAAAAQERRDSLIGLARKLSLVGTGSDQVAGEPGEPRVLSLASMRQRSEPARSDGLWLGTNAVHLLRWCVLVVVGINVLAFPFLLSFVGPVSPSNNQTWFAVLLACDVVLWLDVASRFVTPQWEGGDDGEETRLPHRRVASRYLLAWDGLLLDVLCRAPWDALVAAAVGAQPCAPTPRIACASVLHTRITLSRSVPLAVRPRSYPHQPALASSPSSRFGP